MKSNKPILIHTHFHKRRTGITRSIENVFPFFSEKYEAYVYGFGIDGRKISFMQILKLVLYKTHFIIHCHRNNEIIRALFFRFIGGKFKLISTRHAETIPSKFTQSLHKKTDVVITLTNEMAKKLPFSTTVVGHGINVAVFKPNKNLKSPIISQKNIISCVGRIREKKGQKILLQALASVLKLNEEWALVVVGKSDNKKYLLELKDIVKENSIESQVYFLNETKDIISIYQTSKISVVPSFTEGFSLVCAEAMSCGCAVIATKNVGIHSKLIRDNENGFLFEKGNIIQLQEIIKNIILKTPINIGANARKEIIQKWSSEKEAGELMSIYY